MARRTPSALMLSLGVFATGAAVLGPSPATAADAGQVTQPVQVTKDDENPARMYSTPHVAVDPADPMRMVVSFMDARTRRCGIMTSTDAGATWTRPEASASPDRFPFCLHLQFGTYSNPVAFGRDGTLYQALNGWSDEDGGWSQGNVSVLLGRSEDFGQSWETTIVRDARGKTGEAVESNGPMSWVEIDRRSGNSDIVYVGWNTAFPGQRVDNNNRLAYQVYVAASTDGGRSFSEPVNLAMSAFGQEALRTEVISGTTTTVGTTPPPSPPPGSKAAQHNQVGNFGGWGARMTVDDKGTVYAEWSLVTANISPGTPAAHYVSKSTDRGKTWTHTRISPVSYGVYTFVPGGIGWTEEGGADGTLHVVYDANARPEVGAYGDVFYVRSTDGGKTWSEPRMLTDEDDPNQLVGQYYGELKVAPNGRVDVAWWDARNDPGIHGFDVYYTSSFDNGETWSKHIRATERTISRKVGIWGFNYDMTSAPGLASTNEYAALAWDDTSLTSPDVPDNSDLGGGLQDVVVAAVQYETIGSGGSNAARAALASVVGVMAVGLMLLAVALVQRRRGEPAPTVVTESRAPAAR